MSEAIGAAVAGVASVLLLSAVWWRWSSLRHARALLARALDDPDPELRRSALEALGSHGLSQYAGLLVRRVAEEKHPEVVRALADAIIRNQWEPATNASLVALRLWAARRLAARPTPMLSHGSSRSQVLLDASVVPERSQTDLPAPLDAITWSSGMATRAAQEARPSEMEMRFLGARVEHVLGERLVELRLTTPRGQAFTMSFAGEGEPFQQLTP